MNSLSRRLVQKTPVRSIALARRAQSYSQSDPFEIITDAEGKKILHITRQPPEAISVLAGEMVYQLRSTLDHLAFNLVKLNPSGAALPTDWERRCEFPIWFKPPGTGSAYNCFDGALPGISKPAFALIESWQPYHQRGAGNALRLIAQLSNIDKHRHLNVIFPKVSQQEIMYEAHGTTSARAQGGLRHGAEISPLYSVGADDRLVWRQDFISYVTFDEPTVGEGVASLDVLNVLDVCLQCLKTPIILEFEKLLTSP